MPPLGPIKRKDLIRKLRMLGFDGPYPGGRHEYMTRVSVSVWIPNPHGSDIGLDMLARILRQAGVAREEWETV